MIKGTDNIHDAVEKVAGLRRLQRIGRSIQRLERKAKELPRLTYREQAQLGNLRWASLDAGKKWTRRAGGGHVLAQVWGGSGAYQRMNSYLQRAGYKGPKLSKNMSDADRTSFVTHVLKLNPRG